MRSRHRNNSRDFLMRFYLSILIFSIEQGLRGRAEGMISKRIQVRERQHYGYNNNSFESTICAARRRSRADRRSSQEERLLRDLAEPTSGVAAGSRWWIVSRPARGRERGTQFLDGWMESWPVCCPLVVGI